MLRLPFTRPSTRSTALRSASSRICRRLSAAILLVAGREADVGRRDRQAVGHDHRALDHVLELADVARPRMRLDRGDRVGQDRHRAAALLGGELAHERMREQRRIALAVAQRRDLDDDLGQPIVEVLAEAARRDLVLQVLVRRADDAHVDRNLLPAADPLDDALLQEAQQLDLQRERQVADLVQEQRAAVARSRSCRSSASPRR